MSKTRIPRRLQRLVEARADHRCAYCRSSERVTGAKFAVDHFIPRARGGLTELINLCLACRECNEHKSDRVEARDPDTHKMVPLFNPNQQRWKDHFAWTTEGDQVIGLTPIGRATVEALQLNRPMLVEARKWWVTFGMHPPSD